MQLQMKSVPSFIETQGQLDVDYKIYVACRDGKIYVIRNGDVTDQIFSIESKPIGLVLFDKTIVVAGMNSSIYSFFVKGKKNFTI
jgi:Bardet-Biedl syndrome 1 protein